GVERACLNYLEGFYEGDTTKIVASIKPSLYKAGYWKNKDSQKYENAGLMTFDQAVAFSKDVAEKKSFAKPDAPKKVEVLDIGSSIASAKVTAWWGTDYILLAKSNDKWMIEQVLWEGPLEKP
ncbi:MAG: nuclear transport factor 2 family protein, partial [Cyclobacteriaceae bacterium]